jgi:hypothetical protein
MIGERYELRGRWFLITDEKLVTTYGTRLVDGKPVPYETQYLAESVREVAPPQEVTDAAQ